MREIGLARTEQPSLGVVDMKAAACVAGVFVLVLGVFVSARLDAG